MRQTPGISDGQGTKIHHGTDISQKAAPTITELQNTVVLCLVVLKSKMRLGPSWCRSPLGWVSSFFSQISTISFTCFPLGAFKSISPLPSATFVVAQPCAAAQPLSWHPVAFLRRFMCYSAPTLPLQFCGDSGNMCCVTPGFKKHKKEDPCNYQLRW